MRLQRTIVGLLCAWLAMPVPAQEPVCPLTEDQTQKAVDAFAALAPIFREPRCINCHGAVNPFDPNNDDHQGGSFPPEDKDQSDENGKPKVDCTACHDAFPKWELAPDPMFFVGKDDEALCKQMREMFVRAQTGSTSFMGHMKNDNGGPQFIEVAFLGTRGMTEKELAPDKPEPPSPPWTHARMIQLAQKWVDAMGGRFHGDPSCGCKKQHYSLKLDHTQILNLDFGILTGQYTTTTGGQTSTPLEIPLEVAEPGVFKGEGVMTLGGQGYLNSGVGHCEGQGQNSFLVRATAQMEEGDELSGGNKNKLHVKLTCDQMHSQFSGSCPRGSGSGKNANPCTADIAVDFAPANVDSTQSKALPTPVPNSISTMTTTIVKRQ